MVDPWQYGVQDTKLKTPAELVSLAEELEVENASALRKQELLFAILKNLAVRDVEIIGEGASRTVVRTPEIDKSRAYHSAFFEMLGEQGWPGFILWLMIHLGGILRMEVLRRHPELADLEPELLELAAVMSHQSRDLARIYSDSKVDRARRFLRQRQEEVDALAERLKLARSLTDELRAWLTDVEVEERQAQVQLKRLEEDLRELLPALGLEFGEPVRGDGNVVSLPKPLK